MYPSEWFTLENGAIGKRAFETRFRHPLDKYTLCDANFKVWPVTPS